MHTNYVRRDFLKLSGLGLLGLAGKVTASTEKRVRPNVLVIITDQQHAGMLSCTGNPWVKTPNLDRLAGTGVRFEKAYCANPVCSPSRFTMFSGTMPSVIGMDCNKSPVRQTPENILHNTMGTIFKRADYRTVYGGKTRSRRMALSRSGSRATRKGGKNWWRTVSPSSNRNRNGRFCWWPLSSIPTISVIWL